MTEEIQDTVLNNDMSAGEMLRMARTTGRRKREISTIAKQLCIREEFLQALEDGNYTVLPELVYILGFARNYAMELGIDPDIVVKKIKKEMGIESDEDTVVYQVMNEQHDVEKRKVKEKIDTNLQKIKDSKSCKFFVKYWKWILGALVVLAILGGIIGAFIASSETAVDPSSCCGDLFLRGCFCCFNCAVQYSYCGALSLGKASALRLRFVFSSSSH